MEEMKSKLPTKGTAKDVVPTPPVQVPINVDRIENAVNIPSEQIELPSKGLLYKEGSILSSGIIEMKYMTARDEDILTNESFIRNGTVFDKLFQSLITSPIRYDDLLLGDKNAIMIAARILSYGAEYEITVTTPSGKEQKHIVDLTTIIPKEMDETLITPGKNEFTYTVETTGVVITFRLLTIKDERDVENRLKLWKKMKKTGNLTARLRQMITSVNGDTNEGHIAAWIDNQFLAKDAREFRKYVASVQPNLDFEIEIEDEGTGDTFRTEFTPGPTIFWPDANI